MSDVVSDRTFSGEIKVASRIIDYLSSGLYHSPAACLKELVNNAYDADATVVKIFVKPDADRIIISDNGHGMSQVDFESHFARISESHKRDVSDTTARGRAKIGKIGIGFIAANEICESMELFSTCAGSRELLHVTIDFAEMRKPIEERRKPGGDYVKADFYGEVQVLQAEIDEHYTNIFLTNVRGAARDIMAGAGASDSVAGARTLYGMKEESIFGALSDPSLRTWQQFDQYSQTMLRVALNVPVQYYSGWLPPTLLPSVSEFADLTKGLGFQVAYDGMFIRKPIVLCATPNKQFISTFSFNGEHVAARGYFYAQHGTIRPQELHGLLVRIRNAAVGEYDESFWGFSPTESSVIQRWISAEIWADDRLEEAMNIDRRTLRDTTPQYVELRNAIHSHLRAVLQLARSKIYEAGNIERKTEKAQETRREVTEIAAERIALIAPTAAKQLSDYASTSDTVPAVRRALGRRYTVSEIYELVLEAAQGLLNEEQMEALLKRVTERIGK